MSTFAATLTFGGIDEKISAIQDELFENKLRLDYISRKEKIKTIKAMHNLCVLLDAYKDVSHKLK